MNALDLHVTPLLSFPEILDHFSTTVIPSLAKLYEDLTGCSLRRCPRCHQGCMVPVAILPPVKTPVTIDSS